MEYDGLQETIVVSHHSEAFLQGVTMVLGGVATLFEVSQDGMRIDQRHLTLLCLLHNTNAPVDIGRMAILQVIRALAGNLCAHIESLMAHQHTLFEGFPRETLWWAMSAQMQEVAF